MSERVTVAAGPDGRPVARKVAGTPERADLLRHEAAVLELARHPSVVEVVGLEDDGDGGAALAMAWVGGRRLGDLHRLATEEAAGLVAALATVVADLHDLGLVHGRIEPDHVLVAAGGRPVLCGWSGGGRAGTPPHPLATPPATTDPAHPWGSPLAPAADVHGLGTVLDTLLGGDDGVEPIPDRRLGRRRAGWRGYQRRTLQTLADQATADDPLHRPTARRLAAALHAAVPEARLPATDSGTTGTLLDGLAASRRPVIVGATPVADADADAAADPSTMTAAPPPGAAWPGEAPVAPPAPAQRTPSPCVREPVAAGAPGPLLALPRVTGRSVAAAAAAVVGIALLAGGGRVLVGGRPPGPSLTAATVPTSTAPPVAPCGRPVGGPVADVDGDGCADPVRLEGAGVVEVSHVRFAVGEPGDEVVVGDWDCDGLATPAVVRPSTGELFVFTAWAPEGEEVTVQPVAVVPEGASVEAADADGDGCDAVIASGAGERVRWPEGER
jgi:hypothetical protein